MEEYARTTRTETMTALAGSDGFRFQAFHFETLRELAAAGVARALLPRVMGDYDARLSAMGETVLEQPLWMLYHRQDRDIHHLEATRSWIKGVAADLP